MNKSYNTQSSELNVTKMLVIDITKYTLEKSTTQILVIW